MEKKPVGRPSEYKPEYCELVAELGKKGYSHAQIAAEIGVTRKTLYAWADQNPEFLYQIQLSAEMAQAWWESIGQGQMLSPTPGFSSGLWAKSMSARFKEDYTERTKQEVTGDLSGLTVRFVKGNDNAG